MSTLKKFGSVDKDLQFHEYVDSPDPSVSTDVSATDSGQSTSTPITQSVNNHPTLVSWSDSGQSE